MQRLCQPAPVSSAAGRASACHPHHHQAPPRPRATVVTRAQDSGGAGARTTAATSTPKQIANAQQVGGLEQRFRDSFTMSQVYVTDRPAPIPLSEHEARRRKRDLQEVCDAGKKRGVSAQLLTENFDSVEGMLPGLINLHKAKAADWVVMLSDINVLMARVILLKELFPTADLQKVLGAQPRLLLKSDEQLKEDAALVRRALSAAPNVDKIIQAVPDLVNPQALARSLEQIRSSFKGQDPVQVLSKHPDVLSNMGEASIEDSAEYGELSTKD